MKNGVSPRLSPPRLWLEEGREGGENRRCHAVTLRQPHHSAGLQRAKRRGGGVIRWRRRVIASEATIIIRPEPYHSDNVRRSSTKHNP